MASQNLQDFYNLVDVYLDAVFFPDLTPYKLMQEGWRYDLSSPEGPIDIKGVVYSEMKGAYSSPDTLLSDYTMRSLFPDNAYSFDSGGDPKKIPDLTFKKFMEFHKQYYHPSNAMVYFYGDHDPEKRLAKIDEYLNMFDKNCIDSKIQEQKAFKSPLRVIRSYDPGNDNQDSKARFTLSWLLQPNDDPVAVFSLYLLEYILLGMPGSPLRKALIESGLGQDLTGGGLETEIIQPYFSTGLKGIDLENIDKAQNLIMQTLRNLTVKGINRNDIEAALNIIEFIFRENNTGSYPRGLIMMLRALNSWLYDRDPLMLVAFEGPLDRVKTEIKNNPRYFEELINRYFLDNPHRTTGILRPEKGLIEKENSVQKKALADYLAGLNTLEINGIIEQTRTLKKLQEQADTPENLAAIPVLRLSDMERKNRVFPCEESEES